MKVYIVIFDIDYGENNIEGVFKAERDAVEYIVNSKKSYSNGHYRVETWTVTPKAVSK